MKGNKARTSSPRCTPSAVVKCGSCTRPSSSSGGNFGRKSSARVTSEVARNGLNSKLQSWLMLLLGQGPLEVPHELFCVFLHQLPTGRLHCIVAERHSAGGSLDLGWLHDFRLPTTFRAGARHTHRPATSFECDHTCSEGVLTHTSAPTLSVFQTTGKVFSKRDRNDIANRQ